MDIGALVNKTTPQGSTASEATQRALDNQDRFLTLLVAQMKNQDPMNPMENAQLTTQIAQIQTVTGVDQLNTGIERLSTQFGQSQMMNAVPLMGHIVTVPGDRLTMTAEQAFGQFDLKGNASSVQVEITSSTGKVVDVVNLGPLKAGRQEFSWKGDGFSPDRELHFRVKATRGTTNVASTLYERGQVMAIANQAGVVQLDLSTGRRVELSSIVSVD